MATMTATYESMNENNNNHFLRNILLLIVFITGGFGLYHGFKHGADSIATMNCIDKQGADIIYHKPDDLIISLCFFEEINRDGKKQNVLGIHVQAKVAGKLENITSFINREITSIEDMITFAENDMTQYGYFTFAKEYLRSIIQVLY